MKKRQKAEGKILGRPSETTPEQRTEFLRRLGTGESVSVVAKTYGVSRANIIAIRQADGVT